MPAPTSTSTPPPPPLTGEITKDLPFSTLPSSTTSTSSSSSPTPLPPKPLTLIERTRETIRVGARDVLQRTNAFLARTHTVVEHNIRQPLYRGLQRSAGFVEVRTTGRPNPYEYDVVIAQEQLEAQQKRNAWIATYGPYTVFGSAAGAGALVALRRQRRFPAVVAAGLAGTAAYMILYNPFPLEDVLEAVANSRSLSSSPSATTTTTTTVAATRKVMEDNLK